MAPPRLALEVLRESLADDASLLDQLPHITKVSTEKQGEIPSAVPTAVFFGHHKSNAAGVVKPRIWIYLCRKSLTLLFHSYWPDGEPGGIHMVHDALEAAHPHDAFKFATDPMKLVVLATYYFMLLNVPTPHELAITKSQERVLLDICKDIRQARNPRSMIVKLSVRVPCGLFRAATPEEETIKSACRRSDSGIEDIERGTTKSWLSAQYPNEEDARASPLVLTIHDTPGPVDDSSHSQSPERSRSDVSCYDASCTEETRLDQELEQCRKRLEDRRKRMESLGDEINQELETFEKLNEMVIICESKKRKARDMMSSDEAQRLS